MGYVMGIDLGSTTTKAVLLDPAGAVAGRGLTNTRSDYDVATAIARAEALLDARLRLVRESLAGGERADLAERIVTAYRAVERLHRIGRLRLRCAEGASSRPVRAAVERILDGVEAEAGVAGGGAFADPGRFFRDAIAALFLAGAEKEARTAAVAFEDVMAVFDRAIIAEENESTDLSFSPAMEAAAARADLHPEDAAKVAAAIVVAAAVDLEPGTTVGTGYGRQRLPFPKEQIRSEILCHGLGAHALFPDTRTVLDVGGQDTKAIQVDGGGVVTRFQMNDRCAAGCGRYLGYVADELGISITELGPLAMTARRAARINSTCTVFAGAELRERLSLGEKREDILAGLHRAIVLRAMALLARAGGVANELTFTGGVARNPAVVASLRELVAEHYGAIDLNLSADSIYTGALGAALFARRAS